MAQSEDLNGEDSQYDEGVDCQNTVEEKRNVKTKFFLKYKLFDSICYLIFETIVAIAYLALMILIIINSSSTNGLTRINRIERLFIIVFVIDMFVKILFHFNGHKYSNDKFLMTDSNGQTEEATNESN